MLNLEFPCDVERLENGNTLICDAGSRLGNGSQVIEVTSGGEIVWQYSQNLSFAHSAKRLRNGNTLIADTNHNRVIEVSPEGVPVYSTDVDIAKGLLSDGSHLHYPNDAHLLPDDTLMITDRNNNRCIQITRKGEILWSFSEGIHHPHNCDMLENGHVLIADSDGNRVLEVDRAHNIVWEYGRLPSQELSWPRDADRLPDGNTLIVSSRSSTAFVVTPENIIKWKYHVPYFANFYDADYTSSGTYLISDQQRHQVLEIDESGNTVWQYRNFVLTQPLFDRLQNGSFKHTYDDGSPYGWFLHTRLAEGGGSLIWDINAAPRPMPGIAYDRSGVCCLSQLIRVEPGIEYTVAGSIHVEEIADDAFCYLQMAFIDEYDALVTDAASAPKGQFFTFCCPYTEDRFTSVAPDNAAYAEVRFVVTGHIRAFIKNVFVTDF